MQEVKNYFVNHKKEFEKSYNQVVEKARPRYSAHGCVLLLGPHEQATDMEIRSELPPKSTVDKLVARFLNSDDPAISILHAPSFQQQLLRHWQDPGKSPLEWIGLVYAVLCLAMRSYDLLGDAPPEWKGESTLLFFPRVPCQDNLSCVCSMKWPTYVVPRKVYSYCYA